MIESTESVQQPQIGVKTLEIEVTEHLKAKFWPKVKQGAPDECWPWTGSLNSKGYGHFRISKRIAVAHRVSYTIHFGPIPQGLFICHRCDNPVCVNPNHLFAGTNRENVDDMLSKGRQCRGEDHQLAKLSDEKIGEIRMRWATRLTQQKLADEYGISVGALNIALYHKTWKHLGTIANHKQIAVGG